MNRSRHRPVRVGIIGIGFGQHVLVPAFRADARCQVAGLCASRVDQAQAIAARLGVPKAYGNWHTLVADLDIDAIAIAIPPPLQPTIALSACRERKHVWCEKPLGMTSDESAEMVAAARQSDIAHLVDFEFPLIAEWERAKALVDSGALGRLRHAVVSWQVHTYAYRTGVTSWKTDPAQGGGVLNLFGAHVFAYLEWLLGPIQHVSASRGSSARKGSLAKLSLECANRISALVSLNGASPRGRRHRVECIGEKGRLVLENTGADYVKGFRLWHATGPGGAPQLVQVPKRPSAGADGRILPVARLVRRFLDWACDGVAERPNWEDGHRVQCVLDAARTALAVGTRVTVSSRTPQPAASI